MKTLVAAADSEVFEFRFDMLQSKVSMTHDLPPETCFNERHIENLWEYPQGSVFRPMNFSPKKEMLSSWTHDAIQQHHITKVIAFLTEKTAKKIETLGFVFKDGTTTPPCH